jgi:hypothetical protein
MAVLLPIQPFPVAMPFIPALTQPPKLGEQIFMAGYSEEIELPFNVDKLLEQDFPGVATFRNAMHRGYMADMMGPLFKQGVVGNVTRMGASNSATEEHVECDIFYIDNAMHYGASGGPVFNRSGDAIGVVSQRAVTGVDSGKEQELKVPSGCTVAVSLAPLEHVSRKHGRAPT